MRELNFIEKGKLEWRDADDPKLEGDGEAIVRPVALATCDLDAGIVSGPAPIEGPFAFGHECVAEVVDVGDSVKSVSPGDVVSVPFQISCGECDSCRAGKTGNCDSVPRLSMYGLPMGKQSYGGFASDSVRVPYADPMLVPIPDGVEPAAVASLSDNIPDAWRTVGPPLEDAPGSPVLVCMGAGSIALYSVAIAKALGAERVDVAGGRPADRELAEKLGANVLDETFPERISGATRSRSTRASTPKGSPAPCAPPTPTGFAPASGSTSSQSSSRCSRCSPRGSPSRRAAPTCAG